MGMFMQCCVSVAYIGVLGLELPFTWTVGGEGFCDEVVGSRYPRGEGGTDVLGKSSSVGEQKMKPLWVKVGQQEAGVSRVGADRYHAPWGSPTLPHPPRGTCPKPRALGLWCPAGRGGCPRILC